MSISLLAPQITALTNAAAAAAEILEIMDKPSLLDPLSDEGAKPDQCIGQIEVCNVGFAYPSRPTAQVLHNFTVSIPAGKKTALVGASGSGKSTIIGLLERWYQPSSGSIQLDGMEVSDYNTKWLRTRIRLVQQVCPMISFTKRWLITPEYIRNPCCSGEPSLTTWRRDWWMSRKLCRTKKSSNWWKGLAKRAMLTNSFLSSQK